MGFIEYTLTFGLDLILLAATISYICRLLVMSFRGDDLCNGASLDGAGYAGDTGFGSGFGSVNCKRSLLNQNVRVRSV